MPSKSSEVNRSGVIASKPDCPAFAMVCLEPVRLDIKSGGNATREIVIAGSDCAA